MGGGLLNRNRGRYSVTHILADLLKEPSGCFENFCRLSSHNFEYLLKNISPCSCSTYSPLGTLDIEEEGILTPGSWRHEARQYVFPFTTSEHIEKVQL
ncbi:hypothetical protein Avbf_06618 [Armadillidium vulgare]|nr:hypothetical protein Avbf_06618 [Armadillidium vulgare]